MTAADFGADRSPFTGLLVAHAEDLQRRPLAIKISNGPAQWVRPQSGLSQADLVFEHVAEGITRFTAIFHSQTPPKIGPIRSARLIDLELPAMYDAALGFSGAHQYTQDLLEASDFRARLLRSYEPGYYRTGEDKPYEHTFYADPAGLWEALSARKQNRAPTLSNIMAFSQTPPVGGDAGRQMTIDYRQTVVVWSYDQAEGEYKRVADGEPLTDANNGQQISAANVVVIFAEHHLLKDICVFAEAGQCQVFPIEIDISGQGEALLLRDGRAYQAIWQRAAREQMFTLLDQSGQVLPFQLGNTWFQIVPWNWYKDPVRVEP